MAGATALIGIAAAVLSSAGAPAAASELASSKPVTSSSVRPLTTSVCPALPAHPDANCTGYKHTGVTLKKVPSQATSGTGWRWNGTDVVPTKAGAVISGLDISGGFDFNSTNNVTFSNSLVRGLSSFTNGDYLVVVTGTGDKVQDVEIGGLTSGTAYTKASGVYIGGGTLLRVNIHGTNDGLNSDPYSNITVQDSFIHDLPFSSDIGGDPHTDGSQTQADAPTVGAMLFDHNTIEGGTNDGLFFQAGGKITVTHNYFYPDRRSADEVTSYGVGGGGSPVIGPVVIKDNLALKGFEVAAIETGSWPTGTVISGNLYTDGTSAN